MTDQSISWLKTVYVLLFCFALSFQTFANDNFSNPWSSITEREFAKKEMERPIIPKTYLTYQLDLATLQATLNTAPLRFSEASYQQEVILQLPMPNGEMQRFQIFDAPIMEPELAAKFPMIHSYAGVGLDDPTASLRFDVTQLGFHAMVLSAEHGSVFIDPFSKADTEHYIVYNKNDFQKINNDFTCHLKTENNLVDDESENVNVLLQGSCDLRTYRLALSCTGEYATFHGGTVAKVVAAMNTTMTRVNGIFEREFNANMVLVANNENLIFLDSSTDPYDDSSTTQLINESHTQCEAIIGSANYDIGHVFSTGGGGLAGLGVVCNANNKGRGVTGTNSPIGDPFDIDYVAHEMGHQFGANHTFNNSCSSNRNTSTAMEPGSASTIMGYAGICSPNVQFNSDSYFHAISQQEVANYMNSSTGNNCGVTTTTSNNAPTVDGGADYILPISTPFRLMADGNDIDGNTITYCWEQMDNEIATMPPAATNTTGPAFRSQLPSAYGYRYFPIIVHLVYGIDDDWEELPSVSRNMDFRVTVRDNHQGSGCTAEDDVSLTFSDSAGPFVLQSPNTTMTWLSGTPQTVTWDVANTDAAPINCANVDILLSYDGGYTYPDTLASEVPNDGSHIITVPNQASTTCRVMVMGSNNIFFDISDNDFAVEVSSSPTFVMNVDPMVQDICGSVGSVTYQMDLTGLSGFNEMVNLSVVGLPNGIQEGFSENDFVPTGGSALTLSNLANVANGTYYFNVIATTTSLTLEESLSITINNSTPDVAILNTPTDGATNQDIAPELTWATMADATDFEIEIATNPSFGNSIISTTTVDNNTFTPQSLQPLTVYYWRVKAANNCGEGDASTWFSFQTSGAGCNTYESADTPMSITANAATTVNSVITVSDDFNITSIKSTVNISHSWTGDLKASLIAPNATTKILFDLPGIPASQWGCGEDNILATFDDNAASTATDFDNTCNSGAAYAIEGTYQPIDAFTNLIGQTVTGDWTLKVEDLYANDGGALEEWSLEICFSQAAGAVPSLTNNAITVEPNGIETVPAAHLEANSTSASASQITYVVLTLPEHGLLAVNGMDVLVGTIFTQTDIDNNTFTYYNTNGSATADQFTFDVVTADGAWIQNEIFYINIESQLISANAVIEQAVSCFGENDGMIFVEATGTNPPFTYSLNGGMYQSNALFTNLQAETYIVDVKDNLGNIITTNSITLVNPLELMMSASANGNTVTVTADGGAGGFTYNIMGMPNQSSPIFENLTEGTYTMIVTDASGCTNETQVEVSGVPLTASAEVEVQVSCHDGNDGMIFAIASGGTSPFEYSLNGTDFQTSEVFENLTGGAYTIMVKDNMGNTITTNSVTINNPIELEGVAGVIGNTVTINASGGTGNLMYNINGSNFQSSNVFTLMPNGQFTFGVRDENQCTITVAATVNAIQNATVTTTATHCYDSEDGALTIDEVVGGVPPYLYSLDNNNFSAGTQFADLAAGTYPVYVMDATSSVFEAGTYQVGSAPTLSVTVEADDNNITATGLGGTGDLMYSIDGMNFQENNIFTELSNGTYVVTVMDGNECTNQSIELSINFTALNDLDFDLSFELFPNPNIGQFTIELNQPTAKNLRLQIFDAAGKLVQAISLDKDGNELKAQIDVSHLATGSYELLLTDGEMFGRKRFVKE